MSHSSIILDLDNTLYGYEAPHSAAMERVYDQFGLLYRLDRATAEMEFLIARKRTHMELPAKAASHNRLLYFQKMLEQIEGRVLEHGIHFYNCYWDTFLAEMKLDEGVMDWVLEHNKQGRKIGVLTDLTAHIQFRKIQILGLSKIVNAIVSSEEVGIEKPHPYMFHRMLKKLNAQPKQSIMVGDHWEKDIIGATSVGIPAYWLNRSGIKKDLFDGVKEIKHLNEIDA